MPKQTKLSPPLSTPHPKQTQSTFPLQAKTNHTDKPEQQTQSINKHRGTVQLNTNTHNRVNYAQKVSARCPHRACHTRWLSPEKLVTVAPRGTIKYRKHKTTHTDNKSHPLKVPQSLALHHRPAEHTTTPPQCSQH